MLKSVLGQKKLRGGKWRKVVSEEWNPWIAMNNAQVRANDKEKQEMQ